jgi:hypothetical protein
MKIQPSFSLFLPCSLAAAIKDGRFGKGMYFLAMFMNFKNQI